ncbi:MAG: O-methyltransferase [Gemmatimonadales bacterium]
MPFDAVAPRVASHLEALVPPRPRELQAMEDQAEKSGFPIIGPVAGQLCYLMARLLGARTVFELGSGFGYSTAWFARAVQENGGGVVHHSVWDPQLSEQARAHLGALELGHLIEYHVGEAVEALCSTAGPFDLIFNDIDKTGYPAALPAIRQKLRHGGLLIADNLLWQGRIFDPDDRSGDTEGIREFTRQIAGDTDWTASVLPIRDGLLVARLR